ncbi:MAG: sterol desaturase family protein [Proteobacteria bacterium]|nr:sterol desaturase family protein [Pseudomonadota bacterium]MDA1057811.1 sterol desaturase family protein [Pseudomonadota bacterium]
METGLLGVWAGILAGDFLRYALVAAATFVLIVVWWGLRRHRKTQTGRATPTDIRREITYSLLTVVIFSLNGLLLHLGNEAGVFEVYLDVSRHGWPFLVFSGIVIVVVHDTYFYWLHRLLHQPLIFRLAHRVHHRSHAPTPWAAYAFHPIEAAFQAAFLPLFALLMPLHLGVVLFFVWHMMIRNAVGHSGYEVFPQGWTGRPIASWITAVTHHDLHHEKASGNFGLYFTWWDRLFDTERPDYETRFDHATNAPSPEDRPAQETP